MTTNKGIILLDEAGIHRIVTRIAHEILERNHGAENLAIIGIKIGGVYFAECVINEINKIEKKKLPLGYLDINLYRDDITMASKQPIVKSTDIDFNVDKKKIVLIDDVIYTGRTLRAAMDAIMDFGRPDSIELAVLIDRGHRELPVRANYIGKFVTTTKNQKIEVYFGKEDKEKKIVLY